MIDVHHGEAKVLYLAGIAAHDEGGGVLTDFKSLPARVIPPGLEAEKGGFQKFKHEFLLKPICSIFLTISWARGCE